MKRASSLLALLGLAATLHSPPASAQDVNTPVFQLGYTCLSKTSTIATAKWLSLVDETPVVLADLLFFFFKDCAFAFDYVYDFTYLESFRLSNGKLADLYSYEVEGVTFYFWADTLSVEI